MTVAGAHEYQPIDEVEPLQRQLLGDEAAKRSAEDMRLSYVEVVQERHHIGREVANTVVQRPFPAHIEGYGAKVAREGRDLLEPPPTPEAKAVYQDQWRPLSVDVLVYAGVLGDNYRHIVTSRPAPFAVAREQLALCLKRPPQ